MTSKQNEDNNEKEIEWKDPTKEISESPEFNAVWDLIKTWDICVPEVDGEGMYTSATGNHVRAILDAIKKSRPDSVKTLVDKLKFGDLGGKTRQVIVEKLDEMISKTYI